MGMWWLSYDVMASGDVVAKSGCGGYMGMWLLSVMVVAKWGFGG